MIASHTEFLRRDPMRLPDWRWKRVQQLATRPRGRCGHHDDDLTRQALDYHRRLARCKTGAQRDHLVNGMPLVSQAHALHLGSNMSTLLVQARILARRSIPEISRHTGISKDVIEQYEGLFFDIRDRLDARACIHVLALRPPTPGESHVVCLGWVLRTLAYYGGPVVLDVAAAALLEAGSTSLNNSPVNPSELLVRKVRLLAVLLTLPDDGNPLRLLGLLADLTKATCTGGAYLESPLAGVSEQVIDQAAEILGKPVIEDAVETDLHADMGITETETWEAA